MDNSTTIKRQLLSRTGEVKPRNNQICVILFLLVNEYQIIGEESVIWVVQACGIGNYGMQHDEYEAMWMNPKAV